MADFPCSTLMLRHIGNPTESGIYRYNVLTNQSPRVIPETSYTSKRQVTSLTFYPKIFHVCFEFCPDQSNGENDEQNETPQNKASIVPVRRHPEFFKKWLHFRLHKQSFPVSLCMALKNRKISMLIDLFIHLFRAFFVDYDLSLGFGFTMVWDWFS